MSYPIAAYYERDAPGGAHFITEWRVRPIEEFKEEALVAAWGDDWRSYRPFASWVLEERYSREDRIEGTPLEQFPWVPHQAANSEEQALQEIPDNSGHTVAVDHYLQELQDLRKIAAAKAQEEEARKREEANQAETRRHHRRRSEEITGRGK